MQHTVSSSTVTTATAATRVVSTTTAEATSASTAAGAALRRFVDTDGTTVEPFTISFDSSVGLVCRSAYSMLFIEAMAASASDS